MLVGFTMRADFPGDLVAYNLFHCSFVGNYVENITMQIKNKFLQRCLLRCLVFDFLHNT